MTIEILTGQCLCGAIRYRAEAPETLHYLCHCTHCQRYGGGAYHSAIVVAAEVLQVSGVPKVFTTTADSGRPIARHFCGDCGGHLFTSPWPDATRYSIKAGTLDDPGLYHPAHEIWCQSRTVWEADLRSTPETETHIQGFPRPVAIGAARNPEDDTF